MSVRWRILYHVDVKKVRFWQPAFYGHMVINEDAIFIDGEATHRIGLYDLVELSTEMVPTARMIKIVSRGHTFHVLPCLAHIGRTVNFALPHRKLLKALKQFAAKGESLGVMTTIEPIKTREPVKAMQHVPQEKVKSKVSALLTREFNVNIPIPIPAFVKTTI